MAVWIAMLAPILPLAVMKASFMEYLVPFYFLAMLFGWTSIVLSECPRCGELFHMRGVFSSISKGQCVHCHLPLREAPAKPKPEPVNKHKKRTRKDRRKRASSSRSR